MSKGFDRSIGGSHGSGSINSTSVNRSQASGGACDGYGDPGKGTSQYAKGRVAPQAGASAPMPHHGSRPAKAHNEQTLVKGGSISGKPPNKGRM